MEELVNRIGSRFVPLLICMSLAACSDDTPSRPWSAYATNIESGKLEQWWTNGYETHADCIQAIAFALKGRDGVYSRSPFDCAYRSNSYWKVWMMNTWYGVIGLTCIARNTTEEDASVKQIYTGVLGEAREGEHWRCVD